MNWQEKITGIYTHRPQQAGIASKPAFHPAAPSADIAAAEASLGATLPVAHRSRLLETNGVTDMLAIDGGEWLESMWLLWPIDEVVSRNRDYRAADQQQTDRRSFSNMVFFAEAGTDGILFAFPVEAGACAPRAIVWHPLRNELSELAPTLEDFLLGWLTGAISV